MGGHKHTETPSLPLLLFILFTPRLLPLVCFLLVVMTEMTSAADITAVMSRQPPKTSITLFLKIHSHAAQGSLSSWALHVCVVLSAGKPP